MVLMESFRKAWWIFWMISAWVSPSIWQYLMTNHSSSFSDILHKLKCDGCSLQTFIPMLTASYWQYLWAWKKFLHAHYYPLHLSTKGRQLCMISFPIKNRLNTFSTTLVCLYISCSLYTIRHQCEYMSNKHRSICTFWHLHKYQSVLFFYLLYFLLKQNKVT